MIEYVSSEAIQTRRQCIAFNVLEEKKIVNLEFYTQWNYLQKPKQNKDILRSIKTESSHHHQTNTIRNVEVLHTEGKW